VPPEIAVQKIRVLVELIQISWKQQCRRVRHQDRLAVAVVPDKGSGLLFEFAGRSRIQSCIGGRRSAHGIVKRIGGFGDDRKAAVVKRISRTAIITTSPIL